MLSVQLGAVQTYIRGYCYTEREIRTSQGGRNAPIAEAPLQEIADVLENNFKE